MQPQQILSNFSPLFYNILFASFVGERKLQTKLLSFLHPWRRTKGMLSWRRCAASRPQDGTNKLAKTTKGEDVNVRQETKRKPRKAFVDPLWACSPRQWNKRTMRRRNISVKKKYRMLRDERERDWERQRKRMPVFWQTLWREQECSSGSSDPEHEKSRSSKKGLKSGWRDDYFTRTKRRTIRFGEAQQRLMRRETTTRITAEKNTTQKKWPQ